MKRDIAELGEESVERVRIEGRWKEMRKSEKGGRSRGLCKGE